MGDLEDFFAKKDKKKTKGKKNVMVAANLYDEMQKENNAAQKDKKKSRNDGQKDQPVSDMLRKTKEDEDWEDFDEPQDVNLDGLKVLNLAEKKQEEEQRESSGKGDRTGVGDDGHSGDNEEGGPWKKMETSSVPTPAAAPVVETPPQPTPAAPPAPSTGGGSRYLPPHLRHTAGGASATQDPTPLAPLVRPGRRNKNAPNINDASEFPTLGIVQNTNSIAANNEPGERFESVKERGGRTYNPSDNKPEAVSLSNRWNNLKDEAQ